MTTENFFKKLAKSLELKDYESDRIIKKHTSLRESLRERLTVEEDFLTGSYKRNTLIRPKDIKENFDVDFFLAFSNEDYGEKELSELLRIVKTALTEIKKEDKDIEEIREDQKRSLGVIYKNNFQIDVVPSIQIEKDKLYKIFDKSTCKAVNSNPKLHGQNLTDANDKTESGSEKRLVPIVKILKSWKREKCDYLKSFHLEMLVVEILGNEEIKSFSKGINKFFSNAEGYLKKACMKDPANKENIIDKYLDEDGNRSKILALIAKEKAIAKNALELEESGKEEKAIEEWKKIFADEDKKISESIKSGNFKDSNGQRINSPRSWKV